MRCWRSRCKRSSGLAGTGCTAWDGQKDRNHWCLPACGQARQMCPSNRSVLENPVDAHREFERYRAAQIAVDVDENTLERLFPKGHVNKLGLIFKDSPERRRLRLVVDMRRSNANARAAVPERPILPLPRDIVADWEELFSEASSWRFTSKFWVSLAKMSRATFRMHTVMFWCTRKNSRIVWSRLRLLLLDSIKTLHSCVVWVLVRKVRHSRGAVSRLLLEGLRRQC